MRMALGVEYDGYAFSGWQKQPDRRTVQTTLDEALKEIAGEPIEVVCAGRTDAQVHALLQVVHFDVDAQRSATAWVRGVNSVLPKDVSVLWSKEVDGDFHARFSALSRTYHYWLLTHPVRPALGVHQFGWIHAELKVAAMKKAMGYLLGEHDFSAFRSSQCQANSPVKIMYEAQLEQHGPWIKMVFKANAFLQHMVRNLVGTLVYVGLERESPEWMECLLAGKDRTQSAPTFSPHGLYLAQVDYEAKWQLPTSPARGFPFMVGL